MPISKRSNFRAISAPLVLTLVTGIATLRADPEPATQPTQVSTTAPSTQPAIDPVTLGELLAGLSSDDAHVRQRSEDSLIRMGEDARPMLVELMKQAHDLEVTTRAEGAIRRIDENRLYGPSYVTLHLKRADPREVVAELSRQAFAPLQVFPDNLLDQREIPKVSIDLDRAPFWTAMDQFRQQSGLGLQQYSSGLRLMRTGMAMAGLKFISGPFLIVANQISRTQSVQLGLSGTNGRQSTFAINLVAYAEPKLKVIRASSNVHLEEAVDDLDNSLLPVGRDNQFYYGGGGGCWQLYTRLRWPHNPGKLIKRLKGRISFTVQTKSQTIQIDNLATVKDKTEVVNGVAITIHSFIKSVGEWELKLDYTLDPQNQMGWTEFQQSMNRLEIIDAQGNVLAHRGSSGRGINNHYEMSLKFARSDGQESPSGDRYQLRWEYPLETKELVVAFQFTDLPMPGD